MAAGAGFWNIMAKNYAKSPISDEASYQKKLEKTRACFRSDMDVLEIGCGTGSTALLHAPLVKTYEGVDFSKNMVAIAKGKLKGSGLKNLTFTCEPIDSISRQPNSVDMVLAMNILHLLPNHKEVIGHVYDLLKPGGMIVSSSASLKNMNRVMKPVMQAGMLIGLLPPLQFFDTAYLIQMHEEAGFEVVELWEPKKGVVFIIAQKPA
ncbi:class I SAM-dependent methyltransferase [Falsihalocynthiibacter sp. S25ZX9]|uniref:class I SAM-dependent methyltransferase n=1 Tax=Falsihalocynthiibacter sp. S25ZX9 TaxID=3240870 RepID=UPI00350F1877